MLNDCTNPPSAPSLTPIPAESDSKANIGVIIGSVVGACCLLVATSLCVYFKTRGDVKLISVKMEELSDRAMYMGNRRKESSGSFLSWIFDGKKDKNGQMNIKQALDGIRHPLNLRRLSASMDERWYAEEWTSSQEPSQMRNINHKPPPGTWSGMWRCTLFGLKCVDENVPTPSPTVEPALAPTCSDDRWNRNIYCEDPTIERPMPSTRKRIAMLVSGLDTRFTYADSAKSYKPFEDIDVFVMLQNGEETDEGSYVSPHPTRPPYNHTVDSIKTWYRQMGASLVDVTIVTISELDAHIHANVHQKPLETKRWLRNTRMLGLRRMVYERARDVGSGYDFLLYVREDNVFLEPSFQVKQFQTLCNQDEACYVVSKFCPMGGFSDKLFWLNRAAAEIMFAPMTSRNVEAFWKHDMNTETWITQRMERGGVCAQRWNFRRTEIRYVDNQDAPCVAGYFDCNSGHPFPHC